MNRKLGEFYNEKDLTICSNEGNKQAQQNSVRRIKCDLCGNLEDAARIIHAFDCHTLGSVSICSNDHACSGCGDAIEYKKWSWESGSPAMVSARIVEGKIACLCGRCSGEYDYHSNLGEKFGWVKGQLYPFSTIICYAGLGFVSAGEFIESGFSDPIEYIRERGSADIGSKRPGNECKQRDNFIS